MKYILFFCIFFTKAFSIFVGNPYSPALSPEGFFIKSSFLKTGFLYDYIFKGRYQDKFKTIDSTPTNTKLFTQAAVVTINLFEKLDIYGIIGNSRLQLDQLFYANNNLSWGIGSKAILFQKGFFNTGLDVKYFRTKQKGDYFLIEKELAMLVGDFYFNYEEIQGSLSASYRGEFILPYIGVTYFYSTLDPNTNKGLLQFSDNQLLDFYTSQAVSRRKWGMVIGTTIVNCKNANVNIEARMFDQNGYNIFGEIRF